jgi:hypothetical protein
VADLKSCRSERLGGPGRRSYDNQGRSRRTSPWRWHGRGPQNPSDGCDVQVGIERWGTETREKHSTRQMGLSRYRCILKWAWLTRRLANIWTPSCVKKKEREKKGNKRSERMHDLDYPQPFPLNFSP